LSGFNEDPGEKYYLFFSMDNMVWSLRRMGKILGASMTSQLKGSWELSKPYYYATGHFMLDQTGILCFSYATYSSRFSSSLHYQKIKTVFCWLQEKHHKTGLWPSTDETMDSARSVIRSQYNTQRVSTKTKVRVV
jgi:hypothetical protein